MDYILQRPSGYYFRLMVDNQIFIDEYAQLQVELDNKCLSDEKKAKQQSGQKKQKPYDKPTPFKRASIGT